MMRLADVSAGGNLRSQKEVMAVTIHERAEALKQKLHDMGITTDEELQQALNETRIDIALFVEKPSKEGAA